MYGCHIVVDVKWSFDIIVNNPVWRRDVDIELTSKIRLSS